MLFGPLTKAVFRERPSRFLGLAEVRGQKVLSFIPNPGRMEELLRSGATVYLKSVHGKGRKTEYDLILVAYNGELVSVDSRIPNRVAREAVGLRSIPELYNFTVDCSEPRFGASRLDLKLTDGTHMLLMEVKSCTLIIDGVALFPDAPTKRGARHLHKLIEAKNSHGRSAALFLIQRGEAAVFKPNRVTDPEFAGAFAEAVHKGVEVYVYDSKVALEGITINKRVPVEF